MVFHMVRNSTPQYSWTAKLRISPITRQGIFGYLSETSSGTWRAASPNDNEVANYSVDCFCILLEIIKLHLFNILLYLLD
jgi:hypothetical protein